MLRLAFLLLLLAPSLGASPVNQVCLLIDELDTGHPKYPNQATEVGDYLSSFNVYHKQLACFDLAKKYYMQYFLWETSRTIVYGTRCRYEPKIEDEGKILRYEGNSGGTLCPVVDEFRIDQ